MHAYGVRCAGEAWYAAAGFGNARLWRLAAKRSWAVGRGPWFVGRRSWRRVASICAHASGAGSARLWRVAGKFFLEWARGKGYSLTLLRVRRILIF